MRHIHLCSLLSIDKLSYSYVICMEKFKFERVYVKKILFSLNFIFHFSCILKQKLKQYDLLISD